mmetsp:Transcript_19355/g.49246  ORF Transcript_19355/g.49246 Transcript_19355/m.49246 type:complete len:349 (-) Transcript_19355:311-1357(-)
MMACLRLTFSLDSLRSFMSFSMIWLPLSTSACASLARWSWPAAVSRRSAMRASAARTAASRSLMRAFCDSITSDWEDTFSSAATSRARSSLTATSRSAFSPARAALAARRRATSSSRERLAPSAAPCRWLSSDTLASSSYLASLSLRFSASSSALRVPSASSCSRARRCSSAISFSCASLSSPRSRIRSSCAVARCVLASACSSSIVLSYCSCTSDSWCLVEDSWDCVVSRSTLVFCSSSLRSCTFVLTSSRRNARNCFTAASLPGLKASVMCGSCLKSLVSMILKMDSVPLTVNTAWNLGASVGWEALHLSSNVMILPGKLAKSTRMPCSFFRLWKSSSLTSSECKK